MYAGGRRPESPDEPKNPLALGCAVRIVAVVAVGVVFVRGVLGCPRADDGGVGLEGREDRSKSRMVFVMLK